MRIHEIINEDISRRGFLKGAGAAGLGISSAPAAANKNNNPFANSTNCQLLAYVESFLYTGDDRRMTNPKAFNTITPDEYHLRQAEGSAMVQIMYPLNVDFKYGDKLSEWKNRLFDEARGEQDVWNRSAELRRGRQKYQNQIEPLFKQWLEEDRVLWNKGLKDGFRTVNTERFKLFQQCKKITNDRAFSLFEQLRGNIEGINENTSVNMSPYKEAIQNAETPKKKSAKRKVEDLFNK
jgi:hypothetical protein